MFHLFPLLPRFPEPSIPPHKRISSLCIFFSNNPIPCRFREVKNQPTLKIAVKNNQFCYSYDFRLVHSGHGTNHLQNEDLTFGTRTGTRKGVEAHMFRVETPRELANWSRSLVQGAHDAATLIKEINCGKFKVSQLKYTCLKQKPHVVHLRSKLYIGDVC